MRIASTPATMADVAGVRLLPNGDWADPTGQNRNQHALGEPLTGTIFDMLVEIYQDRLVTRGLLPPEADGRGWRREEVERMFDTLHFQFGRHYARATAAFHNALIEARDVIGFAMAHAIETVHPETLTFERIVARMLEAAWILGEQRNVPAMRDHAVRHGINPDSFLLRHGLGRHSEVVYTEPLPGAVPFRSLDPAAFINARRQMPHLHRETQAASNGGDKRPREAY